MFECAFMTPSYTCQTHMAWTQIVTSVVSGRAGTAGTGGTAGTAGTGGTGGLGGTCGTGGFFSRAPNELSY